MLLTEENSGDAKTLKSHSAGALNTFLRDFIPLYRHAEQMLRRPASSSFTR